MRDLAERETRVSEALRWMREGHEDTKTGCRFAGWEYDALVVRTLLEASLVVYPDLQLVPCLAAMHMYWATQGRRATARAWAARWRNWCKLGAQWSDPLVIGTRPRAAAPPRSAAQTLVRPPAEIPAVDSGSEDVRCAELAKVRQMLGGGAQ